MIVEAPCFSSTDETEMAEHATALSPPPSRQTAADEADFAALLGALQETARGRWFLDEFARRQRNADTLMVLDAVARIEARMAAQQAEPVAGTPAAAADLRRIIDEGRAALAQAAEALVVFDTLKARLDAAGNSAAGPSPAVAPHAALEPAREPEAPPAPAPRIDAPAAEAASAEPRTTAPIPAPMPVPLPTPATAPAATLASSLSTDAAQPAPAVSLGQTLLAEGVVTLPAPPAADALAALRRMTQADRIAFFS